MSKTDRRRSFRENQKSSQRYLKFCLMTFFVTKNCDSRKGAKGAKEEEQPKFSLWSWRLGATKEMVV